MKQLLAEDAQFDVCLGWPAGGKYHGHDEVFGSFFPTAARAWNRIEPVVEDVIEAGDTFVVTGRYEGEASGTDRAFVCDFVHIWRVHDGQLVALRQVADTARMVDALTGRSSVIQAAVE